MPWPTRSSRAVLEKLDDDGGVDAVALVGEHVPEPAQVCKRRGQPGLEQARVQRGDDDATLGARQVQTALTERVVREIDAGADRAGVLSGRAFTRTPGWVYA